MRLLVTVEALKDCKYDLKYHHKMQGFLYGLIQGTEFSTLHNDKGSKFFCFSNLFPVKDFKKKDIVHFLVSSPDSDLIETFMARIACIRSIRFGEMTFKLIDASILNPGIRDYCSLIAGTPIVIRIPKERYAEYGILPAKAYPYLYWRKNYPFNVFTRQLQDNLIKKYADFYGVPKSVDNPFNEFVFKKQVCNHLFIKGEEVRVLGSIWQFAFHHLDEEQRQILQFGLDCGFGEMNSLGFGFMNIS